MTESLADAFARIEDPEVIEQILQGGSTELTPRATRAEYSENKGLSELFQRFFNRKQNQSPATLSQYKRTIPDFIEFAREYGAERTSDLSVELVDSYVDKLHSEYDSDATIHTYTKNVRVWLRWLHRRNWCDKSLFQILNKDELGLVPKARDEALPESVATVVLDKLRRRRKGSAIHALTELLWNAGPRIGGVHSLDLQDFDPQNEEIRFVHRPEEGTRLKNGNRGNSLSDDGERNVAVKPSVIEAIQEYISADHPAVTDEYDRRPLFATEHGRAAKSTLRRWVYRATSCRWAPRFDAETECDGSCDPDSDVCSYSYYPHAIRRGAIVHHLSNGLRPDRASGRFDVSTEVIKRHYDPRTERQRKEAREDAVRDAW